MSRTLSLNFLMSKYKYLDLSGFMFSGKAALHDFLSEISGIWTMGNRVEFDLLRVKDGIADLENSVTSWSPIRSDEATRRFLAVVRKMARGNKGIGKFYVPGFDYSSRCPKFVDLSVKFIEEITVAKWNMYWPYHLLNMSGMQIFLYRIKKRFLGISENLVYRLVSGEKFYERVRNYLNEILSYGVDRNLYHTIVLNNSFEPYDPARFLKYFHDARCIVVDRDPRDIFVTANQYSTGYNDQISLYRRLAGAFDVNLFIDRIKTYRANISQDNNPRVLRITFESLVLDYERTAERIYSFLGINPSDHVDKFKKFDPEISKKNIGLWHNFHEQDSIDLIESAFFE